MPTTTGMKDQGYYDQHSGAQAGVIQTMQDWIEAAAAQVPLPAANRPVVVLDLGSSEGRNALGLMQFVATALRRRTAQPIETLYSDLHSNNFNQLFLNLQASGPPGADVYPAAVPGSFFGPLRPTASVHLATCFNAVQWLDRLPPEPVTDFVVCRRSRPDRPISPAITSAFARQADEDLTRFLQQRARELVPGGHLILGTPGETAEVSVLDGLYDVFDEACRDLVTAGRLERRRYEQFVMPVYIRTVEETLAPLKRPDSPVAGLFHVERAETLEAPNPFLTALHRTGDRQAYAATACGFLRAFSETIVRAVLVGADGDPATVDALYERVRVRLQEEPERYLFRYIFVAVQLRRTGQE